MLITFRRRQIYDALDSIATRFNFAIHLLANRKRKDLRGANK